MNNINVPFFSANEHKTIILCGRLSLWWLTMSHDLCYSHPYETPLYIDSRLGRGTVFGQWGVSKCDARENLRSALILGLVFLEYLVLEPSCHIMRKPKQPCGQT